MDLWAEAIFFALCKSIAWGK